VRCRACNEPMSPRSTYEIHVQCLVAFTALPMSCGKCRCRVRSITCWDGITRQFEVIKGVEHTEARCLKVRGE
jgi:hypothetical protein